MSYKTLKTKIQQLIYLAKYGSGDSGSSENSNLGQYCWRISTGNTYQDIVPSMTANVTDGYEAFASSEITVPRQAWCAFDDIVSTNSEANRWHSGSGFPQYLGMHFPSAVCITAFSIKNCNGSHNGIDEFELQYSYDGLTYETVGNYRNPAGYGIKTLYFTDGTTTAPYWRIFITSSHHTGYCIIDELEFYDVPPIVDFNRYIVNNNPDAYPTNGYDTDGLWYTKVL